MAAKPISSPDARSLGALAVPSTHCEPIAIAGKDLSRLRALLSDMLKVRTVEEHIALMVEGGHAKCPCHLAIGQEAIPVGISTHLNANDRVFGAHRSHGHYLALGGDVYRLFCEVLGRFDGCSHGMGGSMHITAPERGFVGSVPIVGATVPIAVGAGLACKLSGLNQIAVSYFGDGASEEGVIHESLNFAARYEIPVLFVCENNLYSSHLDIALRQPFDSVARIAAAQGIEHVVLDGNDVVAVADAAGRMIARIRDRKAPAFIEAVTYRWKGHVGPKEDVDVGVRRSMEDLYAWKKRDPIARLVAAMQKAGLLDESALSEMKAALTTEVKQALERSYAAPFPEESQLLDTVYAQS